MKTPADRKGEIRRALLDMAAEHFSLDGVPTLVGMVTYLTAPLLYEEEQKLALVAQWQSTFLVRKGSPVQLWPWAQNG